jgi:hypothetical protein
MISARYAPGVAVLLALALIPTVRNTYVDAHVKDGRSVAAIPMMIGGELGASTPRGAGWAKDALAADDAIERRYGPDITLFAARSFDAKRLYHHPELVVAYGRDYSSASVEPASARPEVAIHRLSGENAWGMYALAYEDRFIADPVRFEMRRVLTSLVQPREPMTLFFVYGAGRPPANAEAFLLAAIDSFRAQRAAAP